MLPGGVITGASAGYPVRRALSTSLLSKRRNPFLLPLRHDGLLRFARNDG
jgi:hypothetical protein